jgi:hypothetical protein
MDEVAVFGKPSALRTSQRSIYARAATIQDTDSDGTCRTRGGKWLNQRRERAAADCNGNGVLTSTSTRRARTL